VFTYFYKKRMNKYI